MAMLTKQSKRNLQKIMKTPKNIVFVGIGTPKLCMDAFGPKLATMLQKEGYTVYGTEENPLTRPTLKENLKEIKKKHKKDYIIAIDAAVSETKPYEYVMGEIVVSKEGLRPASYLDKTFPVFGDASIKMICVQNQTYIEKHILEENLEKILAMIKAEFA